MFFGQISAWTMLFFMLYGGAAVTAAIACIYILLRKANAFAPDITPPVTLRRWAAAFFAVTALSHLWWFFIYILLRYKFCALCSAFRARHRDACGHCQRLPVFHASGPQTPRVARSAGHDTICGIGSAARHLPRRAGLDTCHIIFLVVLLIPYYIYGGFNQAI